MVQQETLNALESYRYALNEIYEGGVKIRITDGTRTESDNKALAKRLGWTDEGGKVSRDSQHLTRNGSNGVDIMPYHSDKVNKPPVRAEMAEVEAKKYFSYVKTYLDGHLHVDLAVRGKKNA